MTKMYRMRFYSETKGNSSTSYEEKAYDGKFVQCDFVVKQREYFRCHVKMMHMTEMCAMQFCGNTKRFFSKTCEDDAYDGNVRSVSL